jgi:chitinase
MTKVSFRFSTDLEHALRDVIEDMSFSGLGADGTSEYEVTDVSLKDEGDQTYTVTVDFERSSGKFAGADELEAELTGNLNEVTVTVDYI